jgi:hypothetical protein
MKGDLARQTKHKDIDEYASFSSRKQCLWLAWKHSETSHFTSDHMTNSYFVSRHVEMNKKIFFQTVHNFTMGKYDKCLHFILIFIAWKHIVSLIVQYVSLYNIQKISLNKTRSPRLKFWAVLGLCNILTETKKFALCIILLSCVISKLERTSSLGLEPRTDL